LGDRLFAKRGVKKEANALAAARALPWQTIIDADRALVGELERTITRWNSTIDGWLLQKSTAELIRTGEAANWVPVIAGCNLGEIDGTGVPYITYPSLITANIQVAESAKCAGKEGFVYLFDRVPPGWRKGGCVSFHRLEPGYVFGDWDDRYGFFRSDAFPLARASGAKQEDPELNEADRRVSEGMMGLWTSFARTGIPSVPRQGFTWRPYDRATDNYLLINDPLEVRSGYSKLVG
jgi:hypothetical protein